MFNQSNKPKVSIFFHELFQCIPNALLVYENSSSMPPPFFKTAPMSNLNWSPQNSTSATDLLTWMYNDLACFTRCTSISSVTVTVFCFFVFSSSLLYLLPCFWNSNISLTHNTVFHIYICLPVIKLLQIVFKPSNFENISF